MNDLNIKRASQLLVHLFELRNLNKIWSCTNNDQNLAHNSEQV